MHSLLADLRYAFRTLARNPPRAAFSARPLAMERERIMVWARWIPWRSRRHRSSSARSRWWRRGCRPAARRA